MVRTRTLLCRICMVVGVLALTGCAAKPHAQGDFAAPAAFATPAEMTINPEVASRLAYNAMYQSDGGIRLGAGDRFGERMYTRFVAAVQAREHRGGMYAEVPSER